MPARVGYSPMNEEDDTLQVGKVLRVIGPVVDVEFFTEELPPTYNALQITVDERDLIIEIAQYLGDNVVRCIATASTDGLVRGMDAVDTGGPISMPVGRETLGRPLLRSKSLHRPFSRPVSRSLISLNPMPKAEK